MEFAQLESRIAFLDSEYRREKADLAQLRHRLDLSENEKAQLIKRIESLEAELLSVKSESNRIAVLEDRIDRFKTEVIASVENERSKQKQAIKDVERSRTIEMESHTRAINEIRREVERSSDLDELIALARTETERQSAILVSFQQRLDETARQVDEQLRSISYLEEQRGVDAKKVTELQAETSDLFKRTSLQLSKIELLEQQIPQFGQFQIALEETKEVIKSEVERSYYQIAEVDRKLKTWDKLSADVQHRLEEYESRIERYAQHYQLNIKALEELQSFQEQLRRSQHEFIELQRLTADRQQAKLAEWEDEQNRKVRKQEIESDQRITENVKDVKVLQETFAEIKAKLEQDKDQVTLLLRIIEEDAIARSISAREWHARFEKLATDGE